MEEKGALREFFFYPGAEEIRRWPAEKLRPFLFERLSEQERSKVPDLERVMGLGQLARHAGLDDIETELRQWLDDARTVNAYDIVGLFLMGFWPTRVAVSRDLLLELHRELPNLPHTEGGARDSAIMAIAIGYPHVRAETIGSEIRDTFGELRKKYQTFQPNVRAAIDSVLEPKPVD
jgi:hypothetical protein